MRANLQEVLRAQPEQAVGSFNVLDLEMTRAIVDAAEGLREPVIIGVASRHFETLRAPVLVQSLLSAIEQSSVPVALHLDHAGPDELAVVEQALDLGFTSVMFDGSRLPLEKNMETTLRVVEQARRYGAGIEAELGAIAGEEGVADTWSDTPEQESYTDVAEARRFVRETRVDALAVAIGTAHGIYREEPHVSLETVEALRHEVSAPLVMHGATGISDDVMRRSIEAGIRKVNYFSGLLAAAMEEVRHHGKQSHNDLLALKQGIYERWRQCATEQIRLYAGLTKGASVQPNPA